MSDELNKWQELSAEKIFGTKVFDLVQRQVKQQGEEQEFTVWNLHSNDFCNVVPLVRMTDKENQTNAYSPNQYKQDDYGILLIEQYRFGNQQITVEIPGGMIEDQEQPMDAAARELAEETGYTAKKLEAFATLAPNPAIMDNTAHLVLAYDCQQTSQTAFDELEDIACKIVPANQIKALIMSGKIQHSIVVATLLMAFTKLGWK